MKTIIIIMIALLFLISCRPKVGEAEGVIEERNPTEIEFEAVCAGSDEVIEIIENLEICESGFPPGDCEEYSMVEDFEEELGEADFYSEYWVEDDRFIQNFVYFKGDCNARETCCYKYIIVNIDGIVINIVNVKEVGIYE